MLDGTEWMECECYSDEHVLRWDLDASLEYPDLYASVFLTQYRNVIKRIWVAIKYVLGYKCQYGHWDCFTMRPRDIGRMRQLLNRFEAATRGDKRLDV